jgi:hypothetical protein
MPGTGLMCLINRPSRMLMMLIPIDLASYGSTALAGDIARVTPPAPSPRSSKSSPSGIGSPARGFAESMKLDATFDRFAALYRELAG